jgi:phosphate transport system permease protein
VRSSLAKWRFVKDKTIRGYMYIFVVLINVLLFFLIALLYIKARPIFIKHSFKNLILTSSWQPLRGEFGFLPFIIGTVEVTALSIGIALPVSLLCAIYLSEYAGIRLKQIVLPVIDVLAGIPSVIYGLCGVIVIVPAVRYLATAFGRDVSGYSLLAGGLILAIMILPIIISVTTEVFHSIPQEAREAVISLGTTKWEMIKHVLLRLARRGIVASVVLGLSRAFGETMAVLMVIGNVPGVPRNLFDPAYTLPALIANNYGEMMSIPLYDSALMLAALILLCIVTLFNFIAHFILMRLER